MKDLLDQVRQLAYSEVESTGMPIKPHVGLATEVGISLSQKLGAKTEIVEIGTLLMDCLIGQAIKQGKLPEHIELSLAKANELLETAHISDEDKENIRRCILEHHGSTKFYSLESEICCNADCYRFVSIKGFSYAMRYLRAMPFADLITLLNNKVKEKWNLVSLDVCKQELTSQYEVIEKFLSELTQ